MTIEQVGNAVVAWVNGLSTGVSDVSFLYVPLVDKDDISASKIIVSVPERSVSARTRSKTDSIYTVDIAIASPTKISGAVATVLAVADSIIEAAFGLVLSVGKVMEPREQPTVIDNEYFRQSNIALTVVRLTIRTY